MSRHSWTDERIAEVMDLQAQGLSTYAIADRMGVTRSAVTNGLMYWRRRHGLVTDVHLCEWQAPPRRPNDDRLHLSLMLRALQEAA